VKSAANFSGRRGSIGTRMPYFTKSPLTQQRQFEQIDKKLATFVQWLDLGIASDCSALEGSLANVKKVKAFFAYWSHMLWNSGTGAALISSSVMCENKTFPSDTSGSSDNGNAGTHRREFYHISE
jgi:hypothetical protein